MIHEIIIILNIGADAEERDPTKKAHFQNKIHEYMTRAEKIKSEVTLQRSRGEIIDKIHIIANGTGFGYDSIFGKYLDEKVTEISLEEPYLREYYQVWVKMILFRGSFAYIFIFGFQLINLVRFCELVVEKCKNLKCISVTTVKVDNSEQNTAFSALSKDLKGRNISLYVDYDPQLHDRQIM